MGFEVDRAGRVGQGQYWAFFGAVMILIPILLFGGALFLVRGGIGIGLLMIAAIVPVGIYWRVIMMRRCRDIGWPAFLPWLSAGLQFFASFSLSHSLQSLRYGATPPLALLALPMFMAFADFAFSIVIGCLGSKTGYDYSPEPGEADADQRPRPSPSSPSVRLVQSPPSSPGPTTAGDDDDRYDEAIARALEAHRRGESIVAPAPQAHPAPAGPARPAGGFGRRMV